MLCQATYAEKNRKQLSKENSYNIKFDLKAPGPKLKSVWCKYHFSARGCKYAESCSFMHSESDRGQPRSLTWVPDVGADGADDAMMAPEVVPFDSNDPEDVLP